MILGMPWLKKVNPLIDWVAKTMEPRPCTSALYLVTLILRSPVTSSVLRSVIAATISLAISSTSHSLPQIPHHGPHDSTLFTAPFASSS